VPIPDPSVVVVPSAPPVNVVPDPFPVDAPGLAFPGAVSPPVNVVPNPLPVDTAILTITNPATGNTEVSFVIDETPYTLVAGDFLTLEGSTDRVIVFDRGGDFGEARYTLAAPGAYSFEITDQGWDLIQDAE
jgi:hypothetical protein